VDKSAKVSERPTAQNYMTRAGIMKKQLGKSSITGISEQREQQWPIASR
jgi:hypothetical protein